MNFYRCLICGEVYMGDATPSNCPFCGAKAKHLVPADQWADENTGLGELSDVSRENLVAALQLEANNAPFYVNAMKRAESIELQGVFKYLAKIEREHASVIQKLLKCGPLDPEPGKEVATDDQMQNLAAAHEREKHATTFYADAAKQAAEPRVKKVFLALSEIESDHVKLEGSRL
jgi:rubrerythrin